MSYPPDVSHAEERHKNGRYFLVVVDSKGLDKVRVYGARLGQSVILGG